MPRRPHLTPITPERRRRAAPPLRAPAHALPLGAPATPVAPASGLTMRAPVAVAVLAALAVLTGCSPGPAKIAVPSPAPEVAGACAELVKALPAKVLDAERRETEPVSPLTTAYGDPAIEVTCGVAPPAGMAQAQSQCFEVNGVGWYAAQVTNGYIFTTIGRKLYLELAVPDKYAPEANALTDVADAVKAHNTLVTPCT